MKLRQWIAAPLSVVGLALPLLLLHHSGDAGFRAVTFLFTGEAFADRAIVTGGALDQPSLQKDVFIFCYSLVLLCPFLALVRWLNTSTPRLLRTIFVAVSLIVLVHPLSVLTIFTWDVSRYMYHMGITPMRLLGLAGAVAAYYLIVAFAAWIGGLSRRRPNNASGGPSEPVPGIGSEAHLG